VDPQSGSNLVSVALSQTPAEAAKPHIQGLVHRVVCPFTSLQVSLVLISRTRRVEWHAKLALVHSSCGWDSNPRPHDHICPAVYITIHVNAI